jgi:hypothetical protein
MSDKFHYQQDWPDLEAELRVKFGSMPSGVLRYHYHQGEMIYEGMSYLFPETAINGLVSRNREGQLTLRLNSPEVLQELIDLLKDEGLV